MSVYTEKYKIALFFLDNFSSTTVNDLINNEGVCRKKKKSFLDLKWSNNKKKSKIN